MSSTIEGFEVPPTSLSSQVKSSDSSNSLARSHTPYKLTLTPPEATGMSICKFANQVNALVVYYYSMKYNKPSEFKANEEMQMNSFAQFHSILSKIFLQLLSKKKFSN